MNQIIYPQILYPLGSQLERPNNISRGILFGGRFIPSGVQLWLSGCHQEEQQLASFQALHHCTLRQQHCLDTYQENVSGLYLFKFVLAF
jgi:hypothetical protein